MTVNLWRPQFWSVEPCWGTIYQALLDGEWRLFDLEDFNGVSYGIVKYGGWIWCMIAKYKQ